MRALNLKNPFHGGLVKVVLPERQDIIAMTSAIRSAHVDHFFSLGEAEIIRRMNVDGCIDTPVPCEVKHTRAFKTAEDCISQWIASKNPGLRGVWCLVVK